jgi:hypothetical protein
MIPSQSVVLFSYLDKSKGHLTVTFDRSRGVHMDLDLTCYSPPVSGSRAPEVEMTSRAGKLGPQTNDLSNLCAFDSFTSS